MIVSAPRQLPIAPRPLRNELLSSWLLRTAAANAVSLRELLDALTMHYPDSLVSNLSLDVAVPEVTLRSLSRFTRVPVSRLTPLDLKIRAPLINPALLLRFPHSQGAIFCPRGTSFRLRYAFCPQCIAQQKTLHIRWDWCLAAFVHCTLHRYPLLDACPSCGAVDPLRFTPTTLFQFLCRCCSADLTRSPRQGSISADDDLIFTIETAYRSNLLGLSRYPKLLDNATDPAFRRFIEDMLGLLAEMLSSRSGELDCGLNGVPRQVSLHIIAEIVRNSTPSNDPTQRGARHRRTQMLWSTLFQVLTHSQWQTIVHCTELWPRSLRLRFASAVRSRRRKRRRVYGSDYSGLMFKYNTLANVFDLSTIMPVHIQKSHF